MAREIRSIRKRLDVIKADRVEFNLVEYSRDEMARPARRSGRETHSFVAEENVVGRVGDKMEILKLLLNDVVEDRVCIIPIFGMGGLGKTTLAQLVFNHEEVNKHFELKGWICVSDDFDEKSVVGKIVKTITRESVENMEMEQLRMKLHEKISEKRFLLVLDDVWDENQHKWQKMKELLTICGKPGSRIIVTTRSEKVAKLASNKQQCRLGILGDEDSWLLFQKIAFEQGRHQADPSIRDTGKEIVKKCGGMPLAIKMIASMLSYRDPKIEWSSFLNKELSSISQQEDVILPTLKLSYDCLPSHLKHCFAYCRLFPKDHKIEVETLVNLWIAQGFISVPSDASRCLEDEGYDHFLELAWRSFFQEVEVDEAMNKVVRCKMHDLVHDLAKQVAGEKYASLDPGSQPNSFEKVLHVSSGSRERLPSSVLQAQRMGSFIWPYAECYSEEREITGEVCLKFRFLRTLDLHHSFCNELSISIGELKHLRYLDLSENYRITRLPASITKLVNLQTLNLTGCYGLRKLPKGIGNLVSLRHLRWSKYHLPLPKGARQLTNLQTLTCFWSSEDPAHSKLDDLKGLNNLRGKLPIKGLRSGTAINGAILKDKEHLRSLVLGWDSFNTDGASSTDQEREKMLEELRPHQNLKELIVYGYDGVRFFNWLSSLTNLVELRITVCAKLKQLPFPETLYFLKKMILERCAELECTIKSVNYGSFISSKKTPAPAIPVFPSLQELNLDQLPNFKGWDSPKIEENAHRIQWYSYFPCLTSLSIVCCPKLSSMPLYPKVKELKLNDVNRKPFEQTVSMSTTEESPSSSSSSSPSKSIFYHLSEVKVLNLYYRTAEISVQRFPSWMQNLSSLDEIKILRPKSGQHKSQSMSFHNGKIEWVIDEGDVLEILDKRNPTWEIFSGIHTLVLVRVPLLQHLSLATKYLTSLETLEIQENEEIEFNSNGIDTINWEGLTNLRNMRFEKLSNLVALPEWLQQITGLKNLTISSCSNLSAVPEWICKLSSLEQLNISYCDKLEIRSCPMSLEQSDISDRDHDYEIKWEALASLHNLRFAGLPKLDTLPERLQRATTLHTLNLGNCQNMTTIPDWICKLSSLRELEIFWCPKIEPLPGSIRSLTSFQKLKIYACPVLEQRCETQIGEDWHKIKHIPYIDVPRINSIS